MAVFHSAATLDRTNFVDLYLLKKNKVHNDRYDNSTAQAMRKRLGPRKHTQSETVALWSITAKNTD